MQLEPLTPAQNQLLVKKYWYKEPLSAQEETILVENDVEEKSKANLRTVFSESIDVYLGTSMRGEEQYQSAIKVYEHLTGQGLKVFPPFFMTSKSRLAQSELEAVMLDRCRMMVGVYNTIDTFGLDSEVVNTLLNEKPTFLYLVPQKEPEAIATQERRHKIFRDVHPRTLVGSTGVLHGAHVTSDYATLDKCMKFNERDYGTAYLKEKDGYKVLDCESCSSTIIALRTIQ